jgi:hypothetical protein
MDSVALGRDYELIKDLLKRLLMPLPFYMEISYLQ